MSTCAHVGGGGGGDFLSSSIIFIHEFSNYPIYTLGPPYISNIDVIFHEKFDTQKKLMKQEIAAIFKYACLRGGNFEVAQRWPNVGTTKVSWLGQRWHKALNFENS